MLFNIESSGDNNEYKIVYIIARKIKILFEELKILLIKKKEGKNRTKNNLILNKKKLKNKS